MFYLYLFIFHNSIEFNFQEGTFQKIRIIYWEIHNHQILKCKESSKSIWKRVLPAFCYLAWSCLSLIFFVCIKMSVGRYKTKDYEQDEIVIHFQCVVSSWIHRNCEVLSFFILIWFFENQIYKNTHNRR